MNRRLFKTPMLAVALAAGVCGCNSTTTSTEAEQEQVPNNSALMATLGIAPVAVEQTQLSGASLGELRQGYASLVSSIDDPALTKQIALRLADVEMLFAEAQQMNGEGVSGKPFEHAIAAYKHALKEYGDEQYRQVAMYQLSRAYDLQGDTQQSVTILMSLLKDAPKNIHANEAWFRLGEAHFNNGEYHLAAQAYQHVLNQNRQDSFYTMSAYMQGWAFYKLANYPNALRAFDAMLSASFSQLPVLAQPNTLPDVGMLSKGQQKLVFDSLRVMAVLFSYQGNGEAIVDYYAQQGEQPHHFLVFDELAQQHLDNDRYLDAAATYLAFAENYPTHAHAIPFFVKHIDAFILGEFPSEVMGAKAEFVALFGPNHGIYAQLQQDAQRQANTYLHTYLQELAQSHHSLAQHLNRNDVGALPVLLQGLSDSERQVQSYLAYSQAADYYLTFLSLFPDDVLRPQMQFSLAESYFETAHYQDAIAHYEDVAYRFADSANANEAAYAALLSYEALIGKAQPDEIEQWTAQKIQSQGLFIDTFGDDPRAIAVAQTLMQHHFDVQKYQEAIAYSKWIHRAYEKGELIVPSETLLSAQLVQAHSLFGLEEYSSAEHQYGLLLKNLPAAHHNKGEIERNYAISIYNQAQNAVNADDLSLAVEHLTRLIALAPNSDVSVNAQYDAASYLISLKRFSDAQSLLLDFATRYPAHSLTQNIDSKLMYVYEETHQWEAAADLLYAQWQEEADTENGRQALLLAAQYYQKAGKRDSALPAFRTYAHQYPEPFEQVTEARFTMSEFYLESEEDSKRRYWLKKLIQGHDSAKDKATLRSQTLAAMAAMVFADDARVAYNRIKLTVPLQKSMTKKQKALQHAIETHNKVLAYGVREYVTVANYHLATLYLTLADDLMASERPTSLSALELEQYELLLEEQAYPFEEQAVSVFESNAKRAWAGVYDKWIQKSFNQLAILYPARYRKQEKIEALTDEVY